MIRSIFDTYGSPALVAIFVLLFILESKFQLRKRVQSRWKRVVINFIVSLPAFLLLRILLIPAMVWLAIRAEDWHFGLLYFIQAPGWVEGLIIFLLLDYSNYIWHILLHKLPLMWRFHLVHHTDHDLDVTTAFRFHFGELIASVFYRGLVIILIGASPVMVLIYEMVFEEATQFHHSNIRLPFRFEKMLNSVLVTPRMHGIHHSVIHTETESNYSIIFSFWDRFHKTINLSKPQQQVVTGVPSYGDMEELTIGFLLKLPFTTIRPWKKFLPPDNGNSNQTKNGNLTTS